MKITQAIKMAFASICSTKLRSFLTMLGIIIGVMSVTVLVSIVQSTTNNVSDTLSQLGGNVISATVTSRRSNKITNQSDIADSVSDVTNSMTYMIGGIAGISLLVGGIGIMNIMLVSVTERTKEIGIRKAIGAKKKDILAQFMIESTVLSCMGGVIGIALSAATIFGMNQLMSADYTISAGISLIALAFSAILGIVFGLYPANKAANLKPIEALNL